MYQRDDVESFIVNHCSNSDSLSLNNDSTAQKTVSQDTNTDSFESLADDNMNNGEFYC